MSATEPDWLREPPADFDDEPPPPDDALRSEAPQPGVKRSPHTVDNAVRILAGKCDGAASLDGQGFSAYDSPFGHALAEVVDAGRTLSFKQSRAGYRMLRKYRGQLASAGVDFDLIPEPAEAPPPPPPRASEAPAVGGAAASKPGALHAEVSAGRIRVTSPFRLKDLVKSVPNRRWDAKGKRWTYPESAGQAATLLGVLGSHGLTFDDRFAELLAEHEGQRAAQVHREATDLPPVPVCNLPAWRHQQQAFWFATEQTAAMLAMDMGTGKSRVTVDLLQNFEEEGAQRVVIVCPPKVLGVWPREFRKHAHPDRQWHVESGTYVIKRGKNKGKLAVMGVADRLRAFEHALYDCRCGKPHAVVVNYEATAHDPIKSWAPRDVDYFVMDEIHKIKAPNGVWSRWCHRVGKLAKRRVGLTGTPMPQSPLDVYGQYRALDESIFGTSKTAFESRYAVKGGYGGYEVLGLQREAELNEKFHSIAYMVGAEVLDLPDVLPDLTLSCDLSKEGRRVYEQVTGDMYAQFEAGEITAANVLVKMLRSQQITGGATTTDDGELVRFDLDAKGKPTGKARLLEETLDEVGHVGGVEAVVAAAAAGQPPPPFEPVVVFCRFIHDLDVVRERCEASGRVYMEVSGRRSDGLTADALMNPDCDVVGVQIQSGGTGVDLTRAAYAIYYSLGFSLGDYQQSLKRLHRPGQERTVRFIHLVASDTIDEEVYEALAAREEVVDYVLRKAGVADDRADHADLTEHAMADALAIFGAGL